jgi:hypothetical protein
MNLRTTGPPAGWRRGNSCNCCRRSAAAADRAAMRRLDRRRSHCADPRNVRRGVPHRRSRSVRRWTCKLIQARTSRCRSTRTPARFHLLHDGDSASVDAHSGANVAVGSPAGAVGVRPTLDAGRGHDVAPGCRPAAVPVGEAPDAKVLRAVSGRRRRAEHAVVRVALSADGVVAARHRRGTAACAQSHAAFRFARLIGGAVGRDATLDAAVEREVAAREPRRRTVLIAVTGDACSRETMQ